ncbi:CAMP factor family pore-forming toxin [Vaginisenegalia massiliensis]|uniref:CAMP factor family pore-forming toxin n=1 Tax=Vaginisenegalia massiliensis TaxID=2058294 RepID=UPI000F51B2C7|nr:CAMP factor family pore-forming toxin [Vaginisenegalia massiliensis]
MKKFPLVLSCSLLLAQVATPVASQAVWAAEAPPIVQPANSTADLTQALNKLQQQKSHLAALGYTPLGFKYEDTINQSFNIIETLISDATAITKGEGIDPSTIYALNSIGPRLIAMTEVIEAIDFCVNHLDKKVVEAHNIMGLKVTHLVYTLLNPLASNDRLEQRISELQEMKKVAQLLPDLSPEDTATIYAKAKLDRTIWQTRFTRDKKILGQLPADVYHALNKAITKAVGIQLDPTSTMAEIDAAVAELDQHLSQALQGHVVQVEKRDRSAYIASKINRLQQKETQLEHLKLIAKGGNYQDIIERTLKLVEKVKDQTVAEPGSSSNKVPLKVETIGSRIEALVTIIDSIVFASTEATNKVNDAHKQIGYTITKALIALSDPFASQASIDKHVQRLIDLKTEIKDYPDLKAEDIATIYVKAKLDNAIWNTRFLRDQKVLGKQSADKYHALNAAITHAVGIQLNPKTTVAEIDLAVKELQTALETSLGHPVDSIVSKDLVLPDIVKDKLIVNNKETLQSEKERLTTLANKVHHKKYDQALKEAFKLIDLLGGEIDKVKEVDTLYPIGSIGSRMAALKTVIDSIDYATNELRNKDVSIHKDYGFSITRALIALSDPHTGNDKIQQRIKELEQLKQTAAQTPDLNLNSRANLYVKADLTDLMWQTRLRRDREVLGKNPEHYRAINAALLEASRIKANPNSTVKDVYLTMETLEQLFAPTKIEANEPTLTTELSQPNDGHNVPEVEYNDPAAQQNHTQVSNEATTTTNPILEETSTQTTQITSEEVTQMKPTLADPAADEEESSHTTEQTTVASDAKTVSPTISLDSQNNSTDLNSANPDSNPHSQN